MSDVLCLGIFVADVMAKPIEQMPKRGMLQLFDQMELHTGGCANNTAIDLAKLGVSAGVMGKIGMDGFGDFILRALKEHGVDTTGMKRDSKSNTSFTFVMIHTDGERSFFHYLGANAQLTYENIDLDLVKNCKNLHIAGANLMPKLDGMPTAMILKIAKEAGLTTSVDTAWNPEIDWLKQIEPCLPYTDIFLPSIEEAKMITGLEQPAEIGDFLLGHGVKVVGLKMGEQGCYIKGDGQELSLPAFKVDVVDTSGAGDAFVAGFLAGLLRGWDLETVGRFANAVGATCVTAIGCTAGIKTMEETLKFMETKN